MTCQHQTIHRKIIGQEGHCILCRAEVIFDGQRWVWLYSLAPTKRRKYRGELRRQLRRLRETA